MKFFKKFSEIMCDVYTVLACLFLAVVIVMTFIQVVSRYVFNNSITWTEELARYSFVWCNMLGATVALRHGTHPTISLLANSLHGKVRCWQQILVFVVVIVGSVLMIREGFNVMKIASKNLSTMLRIPMSLVYLAVPVGGFGLLIQSVEQILEQGALCREEGR